MTRRLIAAVVVLVLAVAGPLLAGGTAQALDTKGQLLVLMDSSGSMAGTDGAGSTKIAAAKLAVNKIVASAPADAQLGLRVYGADKGKTDPAACRDSRLLVPVSTVDKSRLTGAAAGMTPRGQTPIAYSLQQAAKDFRGDTPRTILLVSDGIETCNADPCAVAKSLAAQGIALRIDVVGFRVDDAARTQLQCVARAGHGTYYDARNGPSLQSHVERSSTRALREYRPSGTPIDGTSQPAGAPKLTPGQYLDALPPKSAQQDDNTPLKYYTFDWKPGQNLFFSATVIPPASAVSASESKNNGVGLTIYANTGETCGSDTGFEGNVIGGGVRPATAAIGFPQNHPYGPCAEGGQFSLGVSNGLLNELTSPTQLEIVMLAVPKVTDEKALPAQVPTTEKVVTLPLPSGQSPRVAGSPDYTDAPTLTDGSYSDSIRPGETLFYRVKVDWGQRLAYRLDLGPLGVADGRKIGIVGPEVHVRSESPLRADSSINLGGEHEDGVYDGHAQGYYGTSHQVRWRNREAITDSVQAASLAGYYYVDVHLGTRSDIADYTVPLTLTVKADGSPSGQPTYATSSFTDPKSQLDQTGTPATPGGKDSSGGSGPVHSAGPTTVVRTAADDRSSTSPLTWVALGAGVVLVLCGGTVATVVIRRNR